MRGDIPPHCQLPAVPPAIGCAVDRAPDQSRFAVVGFDAGIASAGLESRAFASDSLMTASGVHRCGPQPGEQQRRVHPRMLSDFP